MSISIRKLGVLAILAALLVALAALRPTAQTPVVQADMAAPGGIAALPSAVPAVPGLANQGIPAIIGTGQPGIVAVFCSASEAWRSQWPEGPEGLPWYVGPCPDADGSSPDGWHGAITFKLTQVYPTDGGVPMLTFKNTGTDTAVVTDNAGGDVVETLGVIAVEVDAAAATTGGTKGVNEIVKVTATDETGDARTVQFVVVDTMLAWGPTGQVSTASQEQPVFVSYHCDHVGRYSLWADQSYDVGALYADEYWADDDGEQGLDDMYDGLYASNFSGPYMTNSWGSNTYYRDLDFSDTWCGGDTPGSLFDDFVDFQTDKGLFSIDPGGVAVQQSAVALAMNYNWFYPPSLDPACGEGKNIDTYDIDALAVWGAWDETSPIPVTGGCDLDGWRNGVVTTELLGNGEVGVATITAQQGGGVSPVRTINVTFEGEASESLFITAPKIIGSTGDNFTVLAVDQDGRPLGNVAITCLVSPTGGALAILNQTATTAPTTDLENAGTATFKLIPTGKSVFGGEELTITCTLDRDRSVSASTTVTLSLTPNLESVDLVEGCNPIAATWPDATAIATVAGAVAPADALEAIWKFDPATGTWMGYSPTVPAAVNNLASVNRLDAIFVCASAAAKISRPVI